MLVSGDGGESSSAAELGDRTGRYAGWISDLRASGLLRHGGSIDGPTLRVQRADGRAAMVDIPTDTTSNLRSWLVVDVADVDAAVSLARSCPEARHGDVRVLRLDPEATLS